MRYDSCRQCTKRRIKCDKGAPRCAKCVKKGLECSGIGKTYHFVENVTPETVGTSFSLRNRHGQLHHDVLNDVSGTAVCPNLQTTISNYRGFNVDEDDDVEATVYSSMASRQPVDGISPHRQVQQTASEAVAARGTQYPLGYPVQIYKPGQVMLLNHCEYIFLDYLRLCSATASQGLLTEARL